MKMVRALMRMVQSTAYSKNRWDTICPTYVNVRERRGKGER